MKNPISQSVWSTFMMAAGTGYPLIWVGCFFHNPPIHITNHFLQFINFYLLFSRLYFGDLIIFRKECVRARGKSIGTAVETWLGASMLVGQSVTLLVIMGLQKASRPTIWLTIALLILNTAWLFHRMSGYQSFLQRWKSKEPIGFASCSKTIEQCRSSMIYWISNNLICASSVATILAFLDCEMAITACNIIFINSSVADFLMTASHYKHRDEN